MGQGSALFSLIYTFFHLFTPNFRQNDVKVVKKRQLSFVKARFFSLAPIGGEGRGEGVRVPMWEVNECFLQSKTVAQGFAAVWAVAEKAERPALFNAGLSPTNLMKKHRQLMDLRRTSFRSIRRKLKRAGFKGKKPALPTNQPNVLALNR